MRETDVPNLAQLFGGYFNQDWRLDRSSPAEILQLFVEDERERVSATRAELDLLLREGMSEDQLRDFIVRRLGSYYDPTLVGKPMRDWLEEVRHALS
jgi:hypothetical protein